MRRASTLFALVFCLAGCGDSSDTNPSGSSSGNDGPKHGGKTTDGNAGTFAYGMNGGYYNPQLDDVSQAKLGIAAGVNSQRMKLDEPFLDQWGDDIRVPQTQEYLSMGMQ